MTDFAAMRLLDGALGTALFSAGMPAGVCPEAWIASEERHMDIVRDLQRAYIASGAQILYAPTFGANRAVLEHYGLAHRTAELNQTLGNLSRVVADGADRPVLVAGDLSPTGKFVKPLGDLDFETLIEIYREQAHALNAFCDLFVAETQLQLTDAKAALFACRQVAPEKPFFATFTITPGTTKTMAGTDVCAAAISLWAAGAKGVGLNCSAGPEGLQKAVGELSLLRPQGKLILAKPNAGLPDEQNRFSMSPDEFAEKTIPLIELGADLLGGCCGTTPDHLGALQKRLPSVFPERALCDISRLAASEREVFDLSGVLFGERIVCDESLFSSLDFGAAAFYLHIETESGLYFLQDVLPYLVKAPLLLSAATASLLESALRLYPGRAAVETTNLSTQEQQMINDTFRPAKKG